MSVTRGVLLTPLSIAALTSALGGSGTALLGRLGVPDLEGEPGLLQHGLRELIAGGLVVADGGDLYPVPDVAAIGVALTAPEAVVSLLPGLEGAGSTIVVDGAGVRCLVAMQPMNVLHVSLLEAQLPLSDVIAGMIRAGCAAPSSAGVAVATSRTGVEREERPVALRRAATGGFEARTFGNSAPATTSTLADDELEPFIASLL